MSVSITSNKSEEGNNEDDELLSLTHDELISLTKSTLNTLIRDTSLLQSLPTDVTLDEVDAQIALIHGQSMKVIFERGHNDNISVIVKRKTSTVSDLKRAFKRALNLKLQRENNKTKISWKRVWRVYCLSCDGHILENNNSLLSDYGVCNKSIVQFVTKIRKKSNKHASNRWR